MITSIFPASSDKTGFWMSWLTQHCDDDDEDVCDLLAVMSDSCPNRFMKP